MTETIENRTILAAHLRLRPLSAIWLKRRYQLLLLRLLLLRRQLLSLSTDRFPQAFPRTLLQTRSLPSVLRSRASAWG